MKETHKTIQDLKTEMEAIKKGQTEGILEMKILAWQRCTTEVKFTHRIQIKERILDTEDKKKEWIHQSKKMLNIKIL